MKNIFFISLALIALIFLWKVIPDNTAEYSRHVCQVTTGNEECLTKEELKEKEATVSWACQKDGQEIYLEDNR
jgi:hypothetical protein